MNRKMSARNAQRRYLKNGGKTMDQLIDDIKTQTAEIMQLCIQTALKTESGISRKKIKDVVNRADRYSAMYISEERFRGTYAIRKDLKERTGRYLPDGFFIPAANPPKKDKDWGVLAARQQAAEMTARIYTLAINMELAFDGQQIDKVMKKAIDIYREKAKETGDR